MLSWSPQPSECGRTISTSEISLPTYQTFPVYPWTTNLCLNEVFQSDQANNSVSDGFGEDRMRFGFWISIYAEFIRKLYTARARRSKQGIGASFCVSSASMAAMRTCRTTLNRLHQRWNPRIYTSQVDNVVPQRFLHRSYNNTAFHALELDRVCTWGPWSTPSRQPTEKVGDHTLIYLVDYGMMWWRPFFNLNHKSGLILDRYEAYCNFWIHLLFLSGPCRVILEVWRILPRDGLRWSFPCSNPDRDHQMVSIDPIDH